MYVGYPVSGAIPLGYAAISSLSIVFFFITKKFAFFRFSQLLLILILPFLLTWSLGGFANSSAVIIWAFFSPLAALIFADKRQMAFWLFGFLLLTILTGLFDPIVQDWAQPMQKEFNIAFFVMNLGAGFICVFLVLMFFVNDREAAHQAAILAKEEALAMQQQLKQANSQLKENEVKIRELMMTDSLTGIPNRHAYEERIAFEFKRMQRTHNLHTIAIADIDLFKQINDEFGHDVGDQVIQQFAKILNDNIRDTDFVARIGGEEFFILLPETSHAGGLQLIKRIQELLITNYIPGTDRPVTASFGIATAKPEESPENCIKRADQALYKSKHNGRNRLTSAA